MSDDAISLGELAVRYGLIPEVDRAHLSRQLESGARSGQPTSLAYLLLQRGIPRGTLERLLGTAAAARAVVCDACGHPLPAERFTAREAIPCPRCGAFLVGFAAYAQEAAPALAGDTGEVAGSRTLAFPQVLIPVPAPAGPLSDDETTSEFALLTTPAEPVASPFDSLETAAAVHPRLTPTIEPPRRGAPAPATSRPSPPAALADLPGLPGGLETLDADAVAKLPPADEPPSGQHSRRRRPARTTGVVAVPRPPALWPWALAIGLLLALIALEVVAHVLI